MPEGDSRQIYASKTTTQDSDKLKADQEGLGSLKIQYSDATTVSKNPVVILAVRLIVMGLIVKLSGRLVVAVLMLVQVSYEI